MTTQNNGWISNDIRPDSDGTYLVVLDDYTVTTLDFEEWEGRWDCYNDDAVLFWQPFPPEPNSK